MPEHPDGKTKNPSRRVTIKKQMRLDDDALPMPECNAQHVIAWLFEIGPISNNGMGESPISHAEIYAWMYNTGIDLQSWETRIVKRLSSAYLAESQAATKLDASAPWKNAPYPNMVALNMQRYFEELAT